MKFIIILVILFVLFIVFRKKIVALIVKYRDNKAEKLPQVHKDFIYVPAISSRTFVFAVEITELGNGKATLQVVKTTKGRV